MGMRWLVKEEPENYNFDQFVADGHTVWSGVKNPVAQRNLRAMKKGDRVFFYHTGKQKAVVGTAKVTVEAYPDPKDKSRQPRRRRARARQEAQAAGDARRDQGVGQVRGLGARPHPAAVGHAGDGRSVGGG